MNAFDSWTGPRQIPKGVAGEGVTSTMSKSFIDTNILVYAVDQNDRRRRRKCRQLLEQLAGTENQGVISTQVMQEFFVACTKKLQVDPIIAKGMLSSFENFEVILVDPTLIKDAVDCHVLNQISFWHALIVVSAKSAECERLLTEDLNHGQVISGVQIENPLL